MHDKNGKRLKVGDQIKTHMHSGLLTITDISGGADSEYMTAHTDSGDACGYDQAVCVCEVQKVRSWKELAHEALTVQNACNLSGVVAAFATVIIEVRARLEAEGKGGTDNVNKHPVCRLFSDKVAHLTGTQTFGSNESIDRAYGWAHDMEGKEK